jgi:hypothetical protein
MANLTPKPDPVQRLVTQARVFIGSAATLPPERAHIRIIEALKLLADAIERLNAKVDDQQ